MRLEQKGVTNSHSKQHAHALHDSRQPLACTHCVTDLCGPRRCEKPALHTSHHDPKTRLPYAAAQQGAPCPTNSAKELTELLPTQPAELANA